MNGASSKNNPNAFNFLSNYIIMQVDGELKDEFEAITGVTLPDENLDEMEEADVVQSTKRVTPQTNTSKRQKKEAQEGKLLEKAINLMEATRQIHSFGT